MRRLLTTAVMLSAGCLLLGLAAAQPKDKEPAKNEPPILKPREGKSETIKLFNSKDLDGWEGDMKRWSVDSGEIVGKNADEVPVSTYLLTKQNFSDFRIICKSKLVESEMHSGIAFWGRKFKENGQRWTYTGHLVMFPSGYGLYDLFNRDGLPPSGEPAKKVGHQHDWNEVEILAQGNRIRVAINGTAVMDWRDPEPNTCTEGPIGLQLHSNKAPQEVRFKDITITTFPTEDKLITVKDVK
jgi:Domain of Unknown Function (DUF1080)